MREIEIETEFSQLLDSFLKCLKQMRLGQEKTSSLGLHPVLSCQCRGPHHLSHFFLTPRIYVSRKLEWGARAGYQMQALQCGTQAPYSLGQMLRHPPAAPKILQCASSTHTTPVLERINFIKIGCGWDNGLIFSPINHKGFIDVSSVPSIIQHWEEKCEHTYY